MRKLLLCVAAAAALLVFASSASAADSHAPKGARLDWLPSSEWVMSSWLPFDEARLDAHFHTSREGLAKWLDDHRTLLQLAHSHGVEGGAHGLALSLVGPRLRSVSPHMRRVLVRRTMDTLTQAHLSRHVLFHVFHTPAVAEHAQSVFGVSPAGFRRLRDSGMSPVSIGARGGRTQAQVRAGLVTLFGARESEAVRGGDMSARQARTLRSEQQLNIDAYLGRPFRTQAQQIQFICHPH